MPKFVHHRGLQKGRTSEPSIVPLHSFQVHRRSNARCQIVQGRRLAYLFSSVALAGMFGGLIATAITYMGNLHGVESWR